MERIILLQTLELMQMTRPTLVKLQFTTQRLYLSTLSTSKEAAPVVDFKGRDIYVVRDENPNQRKKLNLSEIWVYDRNELTKGTDTSISIDDVLHFYDNDKVVVTKKTLRDVEFRIQNGIIMVDGKEFPLADKDGFRAVLNLQDNTYDTVVPTKINSMPTLLSMAGQKNTIAVDIFGNVQLIRGDLSQKKSS